MADAITALAPLFDEKSKQIGGGTVSADLEAYLIFLVDQFYLYVHANYSHKESGFMIQFIMEGYYGVFHRVISANGKESFRKLITLDEKAARNAKRYVDDAKR